MARPKQQDALDLLAADYVHVGRHRARKTAKDRWAEFAWLTLSTVILSTVGYFGFQYATEYASTPQPTHHIVNGVDLSTPITVVDGSGTRKYAAQIGQNLLDAEMVVPYSRTIGQTIFFSSIRIQKEEYRPLARKIQVIIGNLPIRVFKDAKYPIEVRLGRNFEVPAN
ncbi:MAG: hypothetical protein EBZ61_02470 [Micrococcales bacterium]|nr:hypothetical protein [Micrococcales bacterium]